MDQKFVDAITNVRMVSGTIRIDLMNISGQSEDNKLQFSKTGEIILSPNAFAQALKTMQDVDADMLFSVVFLRGSTTHILADSGTFCRAKQGERTRPAFHRVTVEILCYSYDSCHSISVCPSRPTASAR